MATYDELFDLRSNDAIRNRVAVALVVKAQELIASPTPTAAQISWANDALLRPMDEAARFLNYVLAANKDATVAQILGAADTAVQTNVNTAVDAIIAGGA